MFKMKKYRVLIKFSGEALSNNESILDKNNLIFIAKEIQNLLTHNIEIAIVIGGGNIIRGVSNSNNMISRVSSDYMGILSTIINGIALEEVFQYLKIKTKLVSSLNVEKIATNYILKEIKSDLNSKVIIFSGGTGNPYFTTDTTAILKASEIEADIVIKATKVNGIYDKDPENFTDAKKIDELTYDEVLSKSINVMDNTAITLAKNNNLPIVICNMFKKNNLLDIILNKNYSNSSIIR